MRNWRSLRTYLAIVAGAYVLMLFVNTSSMPLHANLENLVFDQYQRLRPRPYALDQPVRIVDIDDESINRIGQWPWPRRRMAMIADALAKANVAAVGFTVLFSEKERSVISAATGNSEVATGGAAATDDGDLVFASALSGHRVVLGSILSKTDIGGAMPSKAGFATMDGDPVEYVAHFSGELSPLPVLANSASGVGFLNWTPDADRVIRSVPLLAAVKGQLRPSFVLESLRVAQGASTYVVKSLAADGAAAGVGAIKVGDVTVETQPRGDIRAYFAAADPRRSIPAWKIFEPGTDLSDLEGKIILVGASASLLSDMVATPLNPSTPGVRSGSPVARTNFVGSVAPTAGLGVGGGIVVRRDAVAGICLHNANHICGLERIVRRDSFHDPFRGELGCFHPKWDFAGPGRPQSFLGDGLSDGNTFAL